MGCISKLSLNGLVNSQKCIAITDADGIKPPQNHRE